MHLDFTEYKFDELLRVVDPDQVREMMRILIYEMSAVVENVA
jgi:hypothetical protein